MAYYTVSLRTGRQRAAARYGVLYLVFRYRHFFRNAEQLRDAARYVPLDRLLVETDSPYLAPVPHRGKENQPALVRDVAEYMAVLKGCR